MRLRSVVAVGAGAEALEAALGSDSDALAFRLTGDGASLPEAREAALTGVQKAREAGKTALVAVSHPRTRMLRDDLEAVVTDALSGVLLPHTFEPQEVRELAVGLREFELARGIEPGSVRAFPVIDSARGVLRAAEIAAATPRVAGLVFDGRAYAEDIGARDEEYGPRLAFARGAVVAAARAADTLPLVVVPGFELVQLAHYGFAGAVLPSPRSVPAANLVFTPTDAAIAAAKARREAYAAARAEGAWVARSGAALVDVHTDRKAAQVLDQA